MTKTPNHNYNTPEEGTENWHVPLNENFKKIDSDIEIRGPEAKKGEYEPKDTAKYEATDSGAVYYGNGDTWVLANRKVNIHQSNQITTVSGTSFEDIQKSIDNYRKIILLPTEYTGAGEPLQLGSGLGPDGSYTTIHAHGAVLNYKGDAEYAIEATPPENGTYVDGYRWKGGSISGPDWSVEGDDTAAFYSEDMWRCEFSFQNLLDAEYGLWVRNQEKWSEANELGVYGSGSNTRVLFRLDGGGSSTELNGTNSFRNTNVNINMAAGNGGARDIIYWQNHASTHGGETTVRGFLPDGGIGYYLDASSEPNAISGGFRAYIEFEFGDGDSTAVKIDSNQAPLFISPRLEGPGQDWEIANGVPNVTEINSSGIKEITKNRGFRLGAGSRNSTILGTTNIVPNRNTNWDTSFLNIYDSNDERIYSIGNHENNFTIRAFNDGGVTARDENDDPISISGKNFKSISEAGSRRYLGSFSDHPNANSGDTWYIDGSSSQSEGFYGMTSSGVVQLG